MKSLLFHQGNARRLTLVFALFVWLALEAPGFCQAPPATCPVCPPLMPQVPERTPRPVKGPDSVSSFIDSLTVNDATFEVVVGQGRILTVKEDLMPPGKTSLVAVGDPSIVDLFVVSRRQVRLVGLRMGVTDVSITTVDGRVYNLEIRVVMDLDVLRGQLRCLFPDAQLKLCQLRDHVVVEGQARDSAQV
jgi:Flp pilus assembly secretin CpaC